MLLTSWVRSLRQSLKTRRRSKSGRPSLRRPAWLASSAPAKVTERLESRELLTALVIDQQYVDARNGVVNINNVNLDIDGDGTIESDSGEYDSIIVNLDPNDPIAGAGTGISINLSGLDLDKIAFKEAALADPASLGINVTLNNVDLNSLTFESVSVISGAGGGIASSLTDVHLGKLTVYDSTVAYNTVTNSSIPTQLKLGLVSQTRNTTVDELDISRSTLDGISITSTGRQLDVVGGTATSPIELTLADHGIQNNSTLDIQGVGGIVRANTRTTVSPVIVPNSITQTLELDENTLALDATGPSSPITGVIGASSTTINVANGGLFYAKQIVEIGDELLQIQSVVNNTLTVSRGALGSTSTTHTSGDLVRPLPIAVTLAQTISASATSVNVSDGRIFQAGQRIQIGTEQLTVSSVSNNSLSVTRGRNGTSATAHTVGTRIQVLTTAGTLVQSLLADATSFETTNAAAFNVGELIQIDSEVLLITDIKGSTIRVQREQRATTANDHAIGSEIVILSESGSYTSGGTATLHTKVRSIRVTDSSILGRSGNDGLTLGLTTTQVDSIEIENNKTISSIEIDLTDSPTDGLQITKNTQITANRPQINGLQFNLTRSTVTNLAIDSNTIVGGVNTGGGGVAFNAVDSNVYGTFTRNTVRQTVGNGLEFAATATTSFLQSNHGPLEFDFQSLSSETTLSASITDQDTVIDVIDGRSFQPQQLIRIGDEIVLVKRIAGNTLEVSRGAYDTIILPHTQGERVRSVSSSISGDRSLISGNTFANNGGAGIFANLPANTALLAKIETNQFTQNQARGIDISVKDTSAANTLVARGGISRLSPESTLGGAVSDADTTLFMADTRGFSEFQILQVDAELLRIIEIDGHSITVERGINGTTPVPHSSGTAVSSFTMPLNVVDASVFRGLDLPFSLAIEGEQLRVEAVDFTQNVLLVQRGIAGTFPAFHATNATVTATTGDALSLDIGGTSTAAANTFVGNSLDAIRLILQDNSAASFNIRNNTITGTLAATGNGNGIDIQLIGTNVNQQATNVLRRSNIEQNKIGARGSAILSANITTQTTVFSVSDASSFAVGDLLQIEGEVVQIQSKQNNTLTVARAVPNSNTVAAAHLAGSVLVPRNGGNAGRGINLFFDELSAVEDFRIANNVVANSNDDGIRIRREDDGITRTVNPASDQLRAITILNNSIVHNALQPQPEQLAATGNQVQYGAGLEIFAANGSLDSFDVDIRKNRIIANAHANFNGQTASTNNTASNGVNLRAEADAQLIADLSNNTILFNEGDGVDLTTRENGNPNGGTTLVATDKRDVGGTWIANTITNNFRSGVEMIGRFGTYNLLEIGREGSDSGVSRGNTISANGLNGIDIRRGGSATIVNNQISNNGPAQGSALFTGLGGATPNNNTLGGGILGTGIFVANGTYDGQAETGGDANRTVQLLVKANTLNANTGLAVSLNGILTDAILATLRDNQITSNLNDGIEVRGHVETTILGNFISQNRGRGIDIINYGSTSWSSSDPASGGHRDVVQSNYKIGDGTEAGRNRIISNQLEALYYVSTAELQDTNLLSTNAQSRQPNGLVDSWPAAIMQIDTNTISANGVNSGLPGTGIVFWIGSTGGQSNNSVIPYINGEGFATGPGTIGGLIDGNARNVNLAFANNVPATTTTVINSRTNASVTNNDFEGNFGDDFRVESFISTLNPQTSASNWDNPGSVPDYLLGGYQSDPLARLNLDFRGNTGNGLNVRNLGTYYTNSEPIFKSKNTSDEYGALPFASATRRRDVTRVPSRIAHESLPGAYVNPPPRTFVPSNENPPSDAVYRVLSVNKVGVGNGQFELQLSLSTDVFNQFNGVLPFGNGATAEIFGLVGVNGQPHSANGVYQVTNVNRSTRVLTLANSAAEGGPDFDPVASDGYLSVNLSLNPGSNPAAPFQFPGLGPNTLRIAQGFDTSGAGAANEFRNGDNFFGDTLYGPDNLIPDYEQFGLDPQDWGIWTPNKRLSGVITDVSSTAPALNSLTITAPNHGLSDRRIIEITGVNGLPSANGIFQVEVIDTDTLRVNLLPVSRASLPPLSVDGHYVNGGSWRTLDESFPDPSQPSFPVADVADVNPDPRGTSAGVVTVNFSEPIKNIDVDDVFLTRDGVPVDVSGITITQTGPKQYTLDLTSIAIEDGQYKLVVDAAFPEAAILPVSADPAVGPIGTVTINFTEDVTGVDITDFVLSIDRHDGNGYVPINLSETGPNAYTTSTGSTATTAQGANLNVRQITPSQYTVDLTSVSDGVGDYRFTLAAPHTATLTGVTDPRGGTLSVGEEVRIFAQDHGLATGQYVTLAGIRGATRGPDTTLNSTYRIEVIDKDHFRLATDLTVSSFLVADDSNYQDGSFSYTPGIVDHVGRPFSVDRFNDIADATESWTRVNTAPTADIVDVDPDPRPTFVNAIRVVFSERVNFGPTSSRQITTSDFRLTRDVGAGAIPVSLAAATVVPIDLDANNFATQVEIRNLAALTSIPGRYRFSVITTDSTKITDAQGSVLAFGTTDDFVVVTTGPRPTLVPVTPARSTAPITTVTLQFNEPINGPTLGIATLDATTHLVLTRDVGDGQGKIIVPIVDRNGLPLLLIPSSAVSPTDFTLDLTEITQDVAGASVDGIYELTLLSGNGITSQVDNEKLAVGSKISWIQDSIRPEADIEDIEPSPRALNAGSVTIRFNELVTGLNRLDASTDFTLTHDALDGQGPQPVNIAGIRVRPISPVDGNGNAFSDPFVNSTVFSDEYVIDLGQFGLTDTPGIYTLSLTESGSIEDLTHNPYRATAESVVEWVRVVKSDNNRISDNQYTTSPTFFAHDIIPPSKVFFSTVQAENNVAADAVEAWFQDSQAPFVIPGTVTVSPNPRSTSVGVVTVQFSEAVTGVTLTDFVLTRNGQNVSLTNLPITALSSSSYAIDLNLVTGAPGNYEFSIQGTGSLIFDGARNPLADGLQSLAQWQVQNVGPVGSLTVTSPRTQAAFDARLTFTKPIDVSTLTPEDFRLEYDSGSGFSDLGVNGARLSSSQVTITPTSVTVDPVSGRQFANIFTIDLGTSGVTAQPGSYRLTLVAADSQIVDQADVELGADVSVTWVLDNVAPTADVVDIFPDPLPSGASAGIVNVLFSESVTGVGISDFRLLRNNTPVSLAGVTLVEEAPYRYSMDLTAVTSQDGNYELRLISNDGTPIRDIAGNLLTADVTIPVSNIAARDQWFQGVDTTSPTVVFSSIPSPRNTAVGIVRVTFSEDVNPQTVGISDFRLSKDGLPVSLTNATITPAPGSDSDYLLDLQNVTGPVGSYTLELVSPDAVSPIVDKVGNPLAIGVAATATWVNQQIDPFPTLSPVTPADRLRPAGIVTLNFTTPVEGVDISDFRLTRDGQPVSLRGVQVVTSAAGPQEYFIDLTPVTGSAGSYRFSLVAAGSGIQIPGGDPLLSDASITWVTVNEMVVNRTQDRIDPNPGDGIVGETISGQQIRTLRAAVMEAGRLAGDDVIRVPAGIYNLTITGTGEDAAARGDLDIIDTTGITTIRGDGADVTFIDAGQIDRLFHVIKGATLVLEDVTIRNGSVTGSDDGGAIRNDSGTVIIRNSVISGNRSNDDGGAINNDGSMTIENTTITRNSAVNNGGAIRNVGNLIVENSLIGGVQDALAQPPVDNRNTAGLSGGAIVNIGAGTVSILNSTISGNRSTGATSVGGAIANSAAVTNITSILNTTITATDTSLLVTNGLSFPDQVLFDIRIDTEDLRVTAVSSNRFTVERGVNGTTAAAHTTGAVVSLRSNFNIINSTVTLNSSASRGGGFYATTGQTLVQNTIIAGNVATQQGPDVFGTNANITSILTAAKVSTNLIGNNSGANTAFAAGVLVGTPGNLINPLLGPLASNGGPTLTHALNSGSPAINQGLSLNRPVLTAADASDQRGITRILGSVDIGAYEFGGFFVTSAADTVDATPGDGVVADNYGRATLRAAIMEANALPGPNAIKLAATTYTLDKDQLDRTAPTAQFSTISSPLSNAASNLDPINDLSLTFSEPIRVPNATSLLQNIQIVYTSPLGVTTTTSLNTTAAVITQDATDPTLYTLSNLRSLFAADGSYVVRLLAANSNPVSPFIVADFEGNQLVMESSSGFGSLRQFVRGNDVFAPTAAFVPVAPLSRTSSPKSVVINFSEPIAGLSTDNFTLAYTDINNVQVTIPLASAAIQQLSATQYELDLTSVANLDQIGSYLLSFNTQATAPIQDLAGNAYVAPAQTTSWSLVVDTFPPVATWTAIAPSPRIGSVGIVTISFDEDVQGIDLNDAETHFDLTVDTDGTNISGVQPPAAVSLSGVPVNQVDPRTFTIDLTSVTSIDGFYTLRFTPSAIGSPAISDTATPVNTMTAAGAVSQTFIIGDDLAKFAPGLGQTFNVTPEDATSFGDLDIIGGANDSLIIIGAGNATSNSLVPTSEINASDLDRVFDIYPGQSLTLIDLRVTGGKLLGARDGAGVRNDSGLLSINGVDLAVNSAANGRGGAIFNNSTVTINASDIGSNTADFGGAVFNDDQGTVTVIQSTIAGNQANTDAGAIYNDRAGSVAISGGLIHANSAARHGGAFYNNDLSTLQVADSTLTSNTAGQDGGAILTELAASTTVTNSTLASNKADRGGAIFDQDGQVTLTDSALTANSADADGGALYTTSSATVVIDSSTASGNASGNDGGSIFNGGTLNVTASVLLDSTAGGSGGAIRNTRKVDITDSQFANNAADLHGGAISNAESGVVTIVRSTLDRNRSDADDDKLGDGGAISNRDSGGVSITDVTISNNSAGAATTQGRGTTGGGIHNIGTGTFTITTSTISGNAAESGGGVSATRGMTIVNSTVSTNTARLNGGGFLNNGGAISTVNTTIYNNKAGIGGSGKGGGIRNESVQGAFSLKNTIVAGNLASSDRDISGTGFSNQGFNLIGTSGSVGTFVNNALGNLVGSNASPVDPLLGPLQPNGGLTNTHALLFGSPARDRGSNVSVSTTDQRGFARVFDGDGNGVATVDIGAFESGFVVNTFLDTQDVRPGDLSSADEDGNSSLRAAIMEANQLDGDDTILLIPGTFRLTIAGQDEDLAATGDLDITSDSVTIIGAGTDQTFIDAAQLDRVFHVKPGATLNLKNLTVKGGHELIGGGVLNQGTLNLENVIVSGNSADFGGGLYNQQIQTALVNGISAAATLITVPTTTTLPTQSPFEIRIGTERLQVTNIAPSGATTVLTVSRGFGGTTPAAYNAAQVITLAGNAAVTNSSIRENEARLQGGGIFNLAPLTVSTSQIANNASNAQGGGIYNQDDATLTDTTISGNKSFGTGGGIYNDGVRGARTASITIERSTIFNNEASTRGGAIYNTDEITATNMTISGNSAGASGGGIYSTPHATSAAIGSISLTNATIAFNSTDGSAGGFSNASGSTAVLRNTIIANDTARVANADVQGAFVSLGSNFIGDAGTSTGLQNLLNNDQVGSTGSPFDAVLAPLADNGGSTPTHALLAGSPAIGSGDNSGGEPIDQRLGIRPVDNTADVGAFEVQFNAIRIGDVTDIVEGDGGQTLVSFVVLLSQAAAEEITVDYATEQDTAKESSDFLRAAGTIQFAPGELAKVITVEVNGDITSEDTEKFKVRLSNPVNATFANAADSVAEGTILNDDAYASVSDVQVLEGDSGTSLATFTVTLDKPMIYGVTLDYATSDGTAVAGVDYVATSGSLAFAPNEQTKTVTVTINGDTSLENFETFFLTLTNAIDSQSNAIPLRKGQGVGTIQNDEVSVLISDTASVLEGNSGTTTPMNFTVSLAQPVGVPVSIRVTTVSGTAIGGSDYASKSQVVTFAPSETSKTFSVNVTGDNRYEDPNPATAGVAEDEQFTVTLSEPTRDGVAFPSATVDSVPAIGLIQNDDPAPQQWVIRQVTGGGSIEVLKNGTQVQTGTLIDPLLVTGTSQDDVFTVDYLNGNPVPSGGLTIDGGLEIGGDVLVLQDTNNTFAATNIIYTATGGESGTVAIDASLITYSELEPITDLLAASNRTINLQNGVAHRAILQDDTAIPSNSLFSSVDLPVTFESISFATPSVSLTVNLADGNDELTISSLDPAQTAPVTINGNGGNDNINASLLSLGIDIEGGTGSDTIVGGSSADTINGGAGADSIDGGSGADQLRGHGDGTVDDNANDTIVGGVGNDTVQGDGGNDSILGGDGNDSILGGIGSDTIYGGIGNDRIDGQDGDDQLFGEADNDTIQGGIGNDSLDGAAGADSLEGGDGNDTLRGGAANDTLLGQAGNDLLNGDLGDDSVLGGDDNDTLQTSGGIDVLNGENGTDRFDAIALADESIVLSNTRVVVDTVTTTFSNIEEFQLTGSNDGNLIDASRYSVGSVTIYGNGGNDTLIGSTSNDLIFGGDGVDVITGQGGADTINGGNDRDFLYGEAGNDLIRGDAGNDYIDGGTNNDSIEGGLGQDEIHGGNNNDSLYGFAADLSSPLAIQDGDDSIFGESGNDLLVGNNGNDVEDGGLGDDVIFGGSGADTLIAGVGNDTVDGQGNALSSLLGVDVLQLPDGVVGNDIYSISYTAPRIVIKRTNQTPFTVLMKQVEIVQLNTMGGDDVVTVGSLAAATTETVRFEINLGDGNDSLDASASNLAKLFWSVRGGAGNDSILGGAGVDALFGDDGNDFISAGLAADTVSGGAGDDILYGGSGEDSVNGDAGNDVIRGNGGKDTLIGEAGDDRIYGDAGNDSILGGDGSDKLSGGTENDTVDGGNQDDVVRGDEGIDYVVGGNGNDTVSGGAGNDLVTGGAGRDYVFGDSGNDVVKGTNDPDVVVGGDGNDTVEGNGGFDTLTGGNGSGDAPDAGDRIGEVTEIDNAFVIARSILDRLLF